MLPRGWELPFLRQWEAITERGEKLGLPKIMEDWQSLGVGLILAPLLVMVTSIAKKRGIAFDAALLEVYGSPPEGHFAFDEEVRVSAKLHSGDAAEFGYRELSLRCDEIQEITQGAANPVTILLVRNKILAWDLRGALLHYADHPEFQRRLGLLQAGRGSKDERLKQARARRQATFSSLTPDDRAAAIRDVLISDLFDLDQKPRKRVPLRGLIIAGRPPVIDSGEEVEPFRLLRIFDQILREPGRHPIPASHEIPEDHDDDDGRPDLIESYSPDLVVGARRSRPVDILDWSHKPAAPDAETAEGLITDWTSMLPEGKGKLAVQHYLRSRLLGQDLKAYCRERSLSYEAIQKAAKRGDKRLRKHLRSRPT